MFGRLFNKKAELQRGITITKVEPTSFYDTTNKKNFPFRHNGETLWFSRSVAVCGFVFAKINGRVCILANKRGPGTPDFQGKWNVPCGYLDWDEDGASAVEREVMEETQFEIDGSKWTFHSVETNPKANKQNVSLRYYYIIGDEDHALFSLSWARAALSNGLIGNQSGGEEGEIASIELIDISNIGDYEWAFGHDQIIMKIYLDLVGKNLLNPQNHKVAEAKSSIY